MSSSSPRRLVGVSTKMYFSFAKTTTYISTLLKLLADQPPDTLASLQNIDIFVIPDHVSLVSVISLLRHESNTCPVPILAGAQDAFHEDAGAFTGEVSPAVLAEVGCRILELGHAERRRFFGETDDITAKKAAAAARNGIIPLVCVGERTKPPVSFASSESISEDDKVLDTKAALPEIRAQIEAVLSAVPPTTDVVLAYEPVWAIGAAVPASASYVVSIAKAIRELECVRRRTAGSTRILYGGSAGPGLFPKLKDGADGLFLGRFAHDPEQFLKTLLEVATA
ncbi:triosephosphate isomerase [Xylaria bambusicola]|uniref:triosephosphate isomerase n=1 Tax=Xylaria bambusicola TaxID=326684 RepID=UPI0020073188|nr:triosephosphate isomerase [Xylaria bambusicola]KAI0506017.1 triosephosphate isomerase [Xylaria bambusicola]